MESTEFTDSLNHPDLLSELEYELESTSHVHQQQQQQKQQLKTSTSKPSNPRNSINHPQYQYFCLQNYIDELKKESPQARREQLNQVITRIKIQPLPSPVKYQAIIRFTDTGVMRFRFCLRNNNKNIHESSFLSPNKADAAIIQKVDRLSDQLYQQIYDHDRHNLQVDDNRRNFYYDHDYLKIPQYEMYRPVTSIAPELIHQRSSSSVFIHHNFRPTNDLNNHNNNRLSKPTTISILPKNNNKLKDTTISDFKPMTPPKSPDDDDDQSSNVPENILESVPESLNSNSVKEEEVDDDMTDIDDDDNPDLDNQLTTSFSCAFTGCAGYESTEKVNVLEHIKNTHFVGEVVISGELELYIQEVETLSPELLMMNMNTNSLLKVEFNEDNESEELKLPELVSSSSVATITNVISKSESKVPEYSKVPETCKVPESSPNVSKYSEATKPGPKGTMKPSTTSGRWPVKRKVGRPRKYQNLDSELSKPVSKPKDTKRKETKLKPKASKPPKESKFPTTPSTTHSKHYTKIVSRRGATEYRCLIGNCTKIVNSDFPKFRIHQHIHLGIKPFSCLLCDEGRDAGVYATAQKTHVLRHIQKMHSDVVEKNQMDQEELMQFVKVEEKWLKW